MYVFEEQVQNHIVKATGTVYSQFPGTYNFRFNCSDGNGFEVGKWYNMLVSGRVNNVWEIRSPEPFYVEQATLSVINTGVIPVNVTQVTGVAITSTDVVKANVVQVSGVQTNLEGVQSIPSGQFAYYADIRLERDTTNSINEYTINWFKNTIPLTSGQVTSPTLQVYKRTDGSSLIGLAGASGMAHVNTSLGTVKYDERTNVITVGEPYIAEAKAIIDGVVKTWNRLIGRDG